MHDTAVDGRQDFAAIGSSLGAPEQPPALLPTGPQLHWFAVKMRPHASIMFQ